VNWHQTCHRDSLTETLYYTARMLFFR
jgi:hypothetical protein